MQIKSKCSLSFRFSTRLRIKTFCTISNLFSWLMHVFRKVWYAMLWQRIICMRHRASDKPPARLAYSLWSLNLILAH
jgi:hypothetical protein